MRSQILAQTIRHQLSTDISDNAGSVLTVKRYIGFTGRVLLLHLEYKDL